MDRTYDGEAETGPLATAWHSNKFLDPATDGTVLPILQLNGFKIGNPTILARIEHEELEELLRGCLLSVMDHCLPSHHYVNVVISGKPPAPSG